VFSSCFSGICAASFLSFGLFCFVFAIVLSVRLITHLLSSNFLN
jgi:hypothetical protein